MGSVTIFQGKRKEAKCLQVNINGKPAFTRSLLKYNCLHLDRCYQKSYCISK